jgi:2,3-diketo-5-methylthio-1-phosphopentane phosphatase
MKGMGLESGVLPMSGTYREEDLDEMMDEKEEEKKEDSGGSSPPAKRQKLDPAFNASGATNNDSDLQCTGTTIPLVPRDAKILLLDIEGTTTSISFVKDVLFPYVLKNLVNYLDNMDEDDMLQLQGALEKDLDALDSNHPSKLEINKVKSTLDSAKGFVTCYVRALMAHDVKATGLKSLQGKMWKAGYASGELVGHLYSDFIPMLNWCKSNKVEVCIYSSGSIAAQKLLFGHTSEGDITSFFGGHFDTTSGSKRESASYGNIAKELGMETKDIIFVSDLEAEIQAADDAGMRAVVAVRPGNAPLSENTKRKFPVARSLLQLCGAD